MRASCLLCQKSLPVYYLVHLLSNIFFYLSVWIILTKLAIMLPVVSCIRNLSLFAINLVHCIICHFILMPELANQASYNSDWGCIQNNSLINV